MRLGKVSSETRTLHPETLTSYLYFQAPSRINSVSMGCDMTVSCPDPKPTCLCHRASHLWFPHLNGGNFLHEFFELMMSREHKQFIPIS